MRTDATPTDSAMQPASAVQPASAIQPAGAVQPASAARPPTESELRVGSLLSEFFFAYQPIFELSTGEVPRVEALVRWDHPTHGPMGPGTFLPLLNTAELSDWFTDWSLRTAVGDLAQLRSFYGKNVQVSVNLSQRQLAEPDNAVASIRSVLEDHGEDPRALCIEVIEDLSEADIQRSAGAFAELRSLGIRVVLDDFGTGASALSALIDAGYDGLKIDRRFIKEIVTGSTARLVVEALVSLGEQADITIAAEGIETVFELQELSEMGCKLGQGFLLARPAPLSAGPLTMGHAPIARRRQKPASGQVGLDEIVAQLARIDPQPASPEMFEDRHRQLVELDDRAKALGPPGDLVRCEIGCRIARLALYANDRPLLTKWAFHTSRLAERIGEWGFSGEAMVLVGIARTTDPEYASLRVAALSKALDIRATKPLDDLRATMIDTGIGGAFEILGLYGRARDWYGRCFARNADVFTPGMALCATNLADLELDRLEGVLTAVVIDDDELTDRLATILDHLAKNPFAYDGVEAALRARFELARGDLAAAAAAMERSLPSDHLGGLLTSLHAETILTKAQGDDVAFLALSTRVVDLLEGKDFLRHQLRARRLHASALAAVGRHVDACALLEQLVAYQADEKAVDVATIFDCMANTSLALPLAGAGVGGVNTLPMYPSDGS